MLSLRRILFWVLFVPHTLNMILHKRQIKILKCLDSNIVIFHFTKTLMLMFNKKCYMTEIMRSLEVELTEEKIIAMKLDFLERIKKNEFTRELYEELEAEKSGKYFSNTYQMR